MRKEGSGDRKEIDWRGSRQQLSSPISRKLGDNFERSQQKENPLVYLVVGEDILSTYIALEK